jgi:N,N'-diacetyllegionaminate synthase
MNSVKIGNHIINEEGPTFIIAEAGINHQGKMKNAIELIKQAKRSGADAIKFQTLDPDAMVDKKVMPEVYDIYKRYMISEKGHKELFEISKSEGIMFISTVFEEKGADILESIGVQCFKISSYDLTNIPLLVHVAKKGLPIILSTGLADIMEIEKAVCDIKNSGNGDIILLHCVSSYPAPYESVNLNAIETMKREFSLLTGFSDHTLGYLVPIIAVAKGAKVIEKHFTTDNNIDGPDHKLSLNPKDFKKMVENIRIEEETFGNGEKTAQEIEIEERFWGRRGYYLKENVEKGEEITPEKLIALKPAKGVSPLYYKRVIGKKAIRCLKASSPLQWEDIGVQGEQIR